MSSCRVMCVWCLTQNKQTHTLIFKIKDQFFDSAKSPNKKRIQKRCLKIWLLQLQTVDFDKAVLLTAPRFTFRMVYYLLLQRYSI